MKKKFSLAVVVCLFLVFAAQGQTVNEAESSIILNDTTADVTIVIQNPAKTFDSKISLELLDAENKSRTETVQNVRIKKGKAAYKLTLPLGDLLKQVDEEIAWYRLRYQVGNTEGFISLSELIRDIFELRVAAANRLFPGMNYRIRLRALQPFTKSAVKNVQVEGELKLDIDTDADEDELNLKAKGETNSDGFAVLEFKIPAGIKLGYDAEIKIKGKKKGIVREIEEELDTDEKSGSVFITVDKPIYKPGQAFNVRGLYLDAYNNVATGTELEFSVKDEDDTVLFRETVKTSEFGIASVSWKIPDNAKLGTYRLEIENEDGDDVGYQSFKVTRYDLPNFTVAAKPDKSFYLPADKQAEITVAADYLFGKPVTKGKVRIVQESERRWNYREQKYDTEEKQTFEGEADTDGKFVAKVDLSREIGDLLESSWMRFDDLHFAAYYTDLTTNKTEQKRFDIRLTKEPIHIYFIRRGDNNPNLPVTAYISTFYADGTPAVCDVEVKGEEKTVSRFKTNSFGAGKLEFSIPAE